MDMEEEDELKEELIKEETKCLKSELGMIMGKGAAPSEDAAYDLLMKYKNVWEFSTNVSTSGDSLIITLPKKEAITRGIGKGTPVLVALKRLRFFAPRAQAPRKML